MDSSRPHRVQGDSGSRLNSPASVDGGQASHAPPMNDQGQAIGGGMDILQRIDQELQRAVQPTAVVPQRSAIKRMAKYRPWISLGRKMMSLPWWKIGLKELKECCDKCIAHQRRT